MRLALVLSGGGAKGAFEAGVFAALEDAGLRPEIVTGTSAGALNAAAVAAGFDAARLAAIWTSLTDDDVYRMRGDVSRLIRLRGLLARGNLAERVLRAVGWTWLWRLDPLRRTVTDVLGGERVPIEPGKVLVVTSVEIPTGQLVRFATSPPPPHRRAPRFEMVDMTVDHLLASAAIPLLFEPRRVAGTAYWDGGVLANTPLASALAYEPDAAVIVTTATLSRPAREPASLAEVAAVLIDTVQRFILDADLQRAREINEWSRATPSDTRRRNVPLLLIDPRGLDLGETLHFEPGQSRRLVGLGRRVGAEAIAGWRRTGQLP